MKISPFFDANDLSHLGMPPKRDGQGQWVYIGHIQILERNFSVGYSAERSVSPSGCLLHGFELLMKFEIVRAMPGLVLSP